MPVLLPPVREKTVPLHLPLEDDPEQEGKVTFRHSTTAEQERVTELFARENLILDPSGATSGLSDRVPFAEMRRLQVYLTIAGCNIFLPDADHPEDRSKDAALFGFRVIQGKTRFNGSEDDFKKAWGQLPELWSELIIEAMLEVNPQWKVKTADPN